ncbi:Evolutionarily conserved signaling intermediate in Toll pathway, mitochondrial [Trichoplax sp. H2]|uniref:Evolutionarily conserved signaling intermediate in Toll pathway, mitochondrial n=1 Tax=Trichoplax adhaerens TaxID=10228 RepID=B3RPX5_TRIAD|nr:hypothetical protein TRIADDRAFT_53698 [Trichoplax adhaerens]EDV28258.1 hypothetical protein TRIADDRAFT_53698 [Trichoplax adhaerens]RDD42065.1 Evolutionarily conserved signaling intermediate in Toll pathway, mitochondrial [Trichoplax sp. H2]|eukprot:XP_002110092.1 hypothetical protein TRIADDRAFT_53698 [Trichoplax adhaerens]
MQVHKIRAGYIRITNTSVTKIITAVLSNWNHTWTFSRCNRLHHGLLRRPTMIASAPIIVKRFKSNDKIKNLITVGAILEEALQTKQKDSFHQAIDKFNARDRQRRGHVDFIYSALSLIDKFELEQDIETYNKLLDVFPKDRFVNRSWLDVVWPKPHPQIDCALDVLTKMEEEGILPNEDTYRILYDVFGRKSFPLQKAQRIEYWFTRFKDINPYKLPSPVPTDPIELGSIALQRIAGSDGVITIYEHDKKNGEDKFLLAIQSPNQKQFLTNYDTSKPLLVEGPFRVWLSKYPQYYYVLRAHASVQIGEEKNEEGLVVGTCMLRGNNMSMLNLWIDRLRKEISQLSNVEIIFDINHSQSVPITAEDNAIEIER